MMSLFFEHDTDDMYDYLPGSFVYGDDVYVDDDYMEEKWWHIPAAPGYMISDMGRVWSERSQKFIKPKKMDREGHMGVALRAYGRTRYFYIHRLMAEAFLDNPRRLPVVRHLNDIPDDNDLSNLAWGTQRDNAMDALANGRTFRTEPEVRAKIALEQSKPILCVDLKTDEKFIFTGQQAAARTLGLHQANIWKVLNKQRPQTCGYYFEYLREDD